MDAARLRMLEAMGIDVYALRTHADAGAGAASAMPPATTDGADAAPTPRLAVVCARGLRADARLARLFKHLPQALGVSAGTIGWFEADANAAIENVADAPVYLVFGASMARALGAQLSTPRQNAATIAVTADPARLPGTAADKRALWQALKPVAHRLRGAAD
ncbi:MAG: hypothetical protein JSS42_07855 [Proteobacteria bacterium]|uniref:hypothetical protein n=1 Tax=Rudaea sp. TaxID=2136325 RepID=UPI0032200E3E|nr:hypothetical protein [Pseudomonadota bacterium]